MRYVQSTVRRCEVILGIRTPGTPMCWVYLLSIQSTQHNNNMSAGKGPRMKKARVCRTHSRRIEASLCTRILTSSELPADLPRTVLYHLLWPPPATSASLTQYHNC